jgi:chemotaxis protein MotB
MPKLAWIIGGVLTTLFLVALLGYSTYEKGRELDQVQAALNDLQATAEKTKAENEQAQAEARELKDKLAQGQTRIGELQKEKENVVQTHKSLEDEMRAALESKDVTISQLQGKLTVNILDRVLFDSGEAELKPDGEAVLRKVATILGQHPTLKIHVIGHTDNIPIRSKRFPSNWELSTSRATAAVRFLCEKGGVDPRRLGVVGYGEFRPVADNSTPEGRARNRRIALTILSEELAGADTVPTAKTRAPTPSPNLAGSGTNAPSQLPDEPIPGGTHPPED